MKVIKKTLLILLVVVALLAVIAYLLPEQVHVERTAQIEAPARIVFNQVNDLHCWGKWATWNQIDPQMDVKYINNGIGESAGYEWASEQKQVGNGKLFITGSVPYDSIAISMDFMEGGIATGYFLFDEDSLNTTVTWAFDSHLGNNPLARWLGLMFDEMIGADFEKGLANLAEFCKTIVMEQKAVVEIKFLSEMQYGGVRETVKWEEIGAKMGMMYGMIMKDIQKQKLNVSGMPFAIYHSISEGAIDLECGIPVAQIPDKKSKIKYGTIPASKCAFTVHMGSYETLEKDHTAIQEWITEHDFQINGSPMEIYLTDPQNEPDVEKWVTEIYYPI